MAKIETTTLTPSSINGALMAAALAGLPTFMWGPPGVGKSEIAQQVATALGIAFVDVRLSQMDPTDVRGMPFKVEEDNVTIGVEWSPPVMFPKNINKTSFRNIEAIETEIDFSTLNPLGSNNIRYVRKPVVEVVSIEDGKTAELVESSESSFVVRVLDDNGKTVAGRIRYKIHGEAHAVIAYEEMNSAPPSVLAACYQLILDRRIGSYILPDGIIQFAMGNRETDRGVTFKMPTPLLNRFTHIELRSDFEDWQAWAATAMIHPDVIGFLSAFSNHLFEFTPGSAARGFATPRSWVMVSKLLKSLDANNMNATDEQIQALIYGAVGDGTGAEFFEFRKIAKNLPNPRDVLSGNVTKLSGVNKSELTGLSYAMCTSLIYLLRESHDALVSRGIGDRSSDAERKQWYGWVDNFMKFSMDNFKPEVNIMAVRMALQLHSLPINPSDCKQFKEFVGKYGHILVDS